VTRAAWIVSVATVLGLAVVYWFRGVFGPLLAAFALAYALEPLTARLAQGLPRAVAVILVFAVASALAIGLGVLLVLQGVQLVGQFSTEGGFVAGVDSLVQLIDDQVHRLPEPVRGFVERSFDEDAWRSFVGQASDLAGGVLETLVSSVNTLGLIVLTPFYLFYLMLDMPRLWAWTREHLPARDRERTMRVLRSIHEGLAAFLRGRVVLALIRGVLTAIGLGLLGTPQWFAVGMGGGLLTVVPFLGPVVGWGIAVALTMSAQGLMGAVLVTVLHLVIEGIENFALLPVVMRNGVELHPLTVLFCVVFWSAALGVFGALVAIPLTLVLKIIAREYLVPAIDQVAGRPDG
jgi:predicted PurR-regulated permease PerM